MTKHLYFWLGVFVAALVSFPIALGIMGATEDFARDVAIVAFVCMSTILVLLILLIVFRNVLLQWALKRSEVSAVDVAQSAFKAFSSAANGNVEEASENGADLVRVGLAWYTWSSFYRWVIRTAIALLVIFTGVTGTVLLFEQNKKLGEQTLQLIAQTQSFEQQNELLGLSIVEELRTRLSTGRQPISLLPKIGVSSAYGCRVQVAKDRPPLFKSPNPSSVKAIAALLDSSHLGQNVQDALVYLLEDSDSAVALGALKTLDIAGSVPQGTRIDLNDIQIQDMAIDAPVEIVIRDSVTSGFDCQNCRIILLQSVFEAVSVRKIEATYDSYISARNWKGNGQGWYAVTGENVEVKFSQNSIINHEYPSVVLNSDNSFVSNYRKRTLSALPRRPEFSDKTGISSNPAKACEMLAKFCRNNKFFECSSRSRSR